MAEKGSSQSGSGGKVVAQLQRLDLTDVLNDLDRLCFHCKKISPSGTFLCSNCHIARYCSKECQEKAFPDHGKRCEEIHERRKLIPILEAMLIKKWGIEEMSKRTGSYWRFVPFRNFCRTRQSLALQLLETAESMTGYVNNPEALLALKEAEKEILELLRLTFSDDQGVRSILTFVLLAQDRLQDCYDMIHWCSTIDADGQLDWDHVLDPAPKRGEWPYPRGNNILDDLVKVRRVNSWVPGGELVFLLGLIVIKMVIIRQLESGERSVTDFVPSVAGAKLSRAAIKECIKEQKRQLRCYCVTMQQMNSFILDGIANPEPLLAGAMPELCAMGSRDEAKVVVKIAVKVCERIGARKRIMQLLPELPKYNSAYRKQRFLQNYRMSPLSLFKGCIERIPGGVAGLAPGWHNLRRDVEGGRLQ